MHHIRVLIVEDEWIVSEEVKEILAANGYVVVGQAEDAQSAINLIRAESVDIALLDINIKGDRDGIDLAREILHEHKCAVIFLTAFDDEHFLNRAKKVKPAAYIIKPFDSRNLIATIEIAFNNLLDEQVQPTSDSYVGGDHIFLKEGTRFRKVMLESIRYVEATGSYVDIHCDDVKHTLAINLKNFEEQLSNSAFMRIHRSYLVNLNKIEEYEGNQVFIDGRAIPISSSHKEEFLKRFKFI